MSDTRAWSSSVVTPTLIGTGLQLLMVIAGHFSPTVAQGFAAGGMAISAVAGLLAGRSGPPASFGMAAGHGAVAGGVCAFVGILMSYLLGDVTAAVLAFGTAGSAMAGAIGGVVGRKLTARSTQRA